MPIANVGFSSMGFRFSASESRALSSPFAVSCFLRDPKVDGSLRGRIRVMGIVTQGETQSDQRMIANCKQRAKFN